jgi:hypothetical protein
MADDGEASPVPVRDESPTLTLAQRKGGATPPTPDVRLYHRAVVAPMEPPLRGLVRQLSIDQLDNEGRRVSIYDKALPTDGAGGASTGAWRGTLAGAQRGRPRTFTAPAMARSSRLLVFLLARRLTLRPAHPPPSFLPPQPPPGKSPLFTRSLSMPGVHKRVIHELLRPRQWKPNHEDRRFMLSVRLPRQRPAAGRGVPAPRGKQQQLQPPRRPLPATGAHAHPAPPSPACPPVALLLL